MPPPPSAASTVTAIVYTCPMHPEVRRDRPGACPICGMALEPETPSLDEGENPELVDFRHRFFWTLPLTVVVTVLAMTGERWAWLDAGTRELDRAHMHAADRAVGRMAFPDSRITFHSPPQSEHVDADRTGDVHGVHLQRRGDGVSCIVSRFASGNGPDTCVLRGGRRDHLADAAGTNSRTQSPLSHVSGDQIAVGSGTQDGAPPECRWHRGRYPVDARARRRPAARAPR